MNSAIERLLALRVGDAMTKEDRYVFLLTAGVCMWNMGVGYVGGLALWYAFRWGWLEV